MSNIKPLTFIVNGKPYGQKRARAVRMGGFIRMYSPKGNIDYAKMVQEAFLEMARGKTLPFYEQVPIGVKITAFFATPKLTKKEQALNLPKHKYPCKKSDVDNIAKAILDALNNFAYEDDAYVIDLQVVKRYDNFEERVIVELWQIKQG
jgi:Holliday junction resolvase RusA-like endonuclease